MSVVSLDILKGYFETGDKPTQQQFANLIDTLAAMTSANDFYSTDGTVTADRIVDGDSKELTFFNFLNLFAQVQNTAGFARTNGNRYFVFDAVNKKISIGDVDGEVNSTLFEISDVTQQAIVKALLGFGIKNGGGFSALLKSTNLTANRNIEFQDAAGTIAYTSQIPDVSTKADLVGGLVPSSQLPSYVDDVLEYANLAAFPGTGETSKIYVAIDTNSSYRWSGSVYVRLDDSVALGETSGTAYRGDRGKTAYDHSQITGANPHAATTSHISEGSNKYYTDARVLAALLTGYASGAGTITSADSILAAIQKLNGNLAAKVKDTAEQVYAASMTITTSSTSPSGTTGHYYQWSQEGRVVTMFLYLKWATAGSGMTQLLLDIPSDMPLPANITGTTSGHNMYICSAHAFNTATGIGNTMWAFVNNGSTRAARITINHSSQGNSVYQIMVRYPTDN